MDFFFKWKIKNYSSNINKYFFFDSVGSDYLFGIFLGQDIFFAIQFGDIIKNIAPVLKS